MKHSYKGLIFCLISQLKTRIVLLGPSLCAKLANILAEWYYNDTIYCLHSLVFEQVKHDNQRAFQVMVGGFSYLLIELG